VNLDVTYYNKQTKDALIALPIARPRRRRRSPYARTWRPCTTRWETTVNAVLFDRAQSAGISATGSHNTNKVASLGTDATGVPNKTIGTDRCAIQLGSR
jgi:hypothetical protein